MSPEVTLIKTGTSNVASVRVAMERLGATTKLTADPAEIEDASILILPGVGSFGAAMQRINESKLGDVIAKRIADERPLLAICLGMQLLFSDSEESSGVEGIGALEGHFEKFPPSVISPLLGWAEIENAEGGALLNEKGFAYFAHSYRLKQEPEGWKKALTVYDSEYVAALERGAMLVCQFHPELSGAWGSRLLGRWLARGLEASA